MIKPRKIFSRFNKESAQTMVEFALVFPIVLMITYGIIEFGRMVFIYTAVTGAAREGARYGAASGSLVTPFYMDCAGIQAATQRGAILTPILASNITIWYDNGPGTAHLRDYCPPATGTIKLGSRIGVRVVARYEPIIAFLGLSGFNITSDNARTIVVNVQMETPAP